MASFASTLNVPADYATIQEAVDASYDGDTVIVAPGTYVENIDFQGKAITVMSSDGPAKTAVDGSQSGSVVVFQSCEGPDSVLEGFTLFNGTGYGATPILPNAAGGGILCFIQASPTIKGNVITGNTAVFGGGICCFESSSPCISDNVISLNSASGSKGAGGGIYCIWSSSPVISQNRILQNSAGACGGGIECLSYSSPWIEDNIITDNSTTFSGGGIDCFDNASPVIDHNVISNNNAQKGGGIFCELYCSPVILDNAVSENVATLNGGGVCCQHAYPTIVNTVIAKNSNGFFGCGGGIHCASCGSLTIVNATIIENAAGMINGSGGGICCVESSTVISNTILWHNTAKQGPEISVEGSKAPSLFFISHSDVEGGQGAVHVELGCVLDWGPGMLDIDPLFVEPTNKDFHIQYASPCRDAGDGSIPGLPEADFEGDPRTAFNAPDMGADEFHLHLYAVGDAAPGGQVKLKFVGLPGTLPVHLWLGSGVMDPPMHTKYGDWCLEFPLLAQAGLGSIPHPEGVLVLEFTLPSSIPLPLSLPFQSGVGIELTNPCTIEVQ